MNDELKNIGREQERKKEAGYGTKPECRTKQKRF